MQDIHAPDTQGFIPGVFNYCDRRCERCCFVRQCRVGSLDVDDVGEAEDALASAGPEDLLERLRSLMDMRQDLDEEDENEDSDGGEEEGFHFDPSDLEPDPDHERKRAEIDRRAKEHPLSAMGITYVVLVEEWMGPRAEALKAMGVSLSPMDELGLAASLRTEGAMVLNEALDEVQWFQHMLHIKCQRALRGKIEDPEWLADMGNGPIQSDWNGTAKLALEIVDRCQKAWRTVEEMLPEAADDILPIQELLRRIAEELRKEFPETERFVRAGFDAPRQPEWEGE